MFHRRHPALVAFVSVVLAELAAPVRQAQARETGFNMPCWNCHEGQAPPAVSVEMLSADLMLGETMDFTVIHQSSATVAGVLVDSQGSGTLALVDTVGTRFMEENPGQMTHVMPHPIMNGEVRFPFRWTAPETPGVSRLIIFSVAANANHDAHDDSARQFMLDIAHGCEAVTYFVDEDGDGFGDAATPERSCQPIEGKITVGGDCNDDSVEMYPGAPELCNLLDDNCDGVIDDGLTSGIFYPDADGDGHGNRDADAEFGCSNMTGVSATRDDCNDQNAAVSPSAAEVTNGVDDNCNGQIDEAGVTAPCPGAGGCEAGVGGAGGTPIAAAGTCTGADCAPSTSGEEEAGCRFAVGGQRPLVPAAVTLLALVFAGRRVRRSIA